jgi:hypothetical protein
MLVKVIKTVIMIFFYQMYSNVDGCGQIFVASNGKISVNVTY